MIEILDIEGVNILGFGFEGKIEAEDIELVWQELEAKLKTAENIRFYIEARNFSLNNISLDAVIEDLKRWLKNPGAVGKMEKVALVTDLKWLRTLTDVECSVIPTLSCGTFSFAEKERAQKWLKSGKAEPDEVNIKWAELVEVGLLRSLAGIGIGLLAADFFSGKSRKAIGLSLFFGSVAVGVPIGMKVLKKNKGVLCGEN